MFANQRRGTAGLGSITGVALVALLWLISATVMLKTYREGGAVAAPSGACELVCRVHPTELKKG
jgi:hypothetical protein